jgi:hypothetical protein
LRWTWTWKEEEEEEVVGVCLASYPILWVGGWMEGGIFGTEHIDI